MPLTNFPSSGQHTSASSTPLWRPQTTRRARTCPGLAVMHNAGTDGQPWALPAHKDRVSAPAHRPLCSHGTRNPSSSCASSARSTSDAPDLPVAIALLARPSLLTGGEGDCDAACMLIPPKSRELAWLSSAGRLRPPPPATELSSKERGSRPRALAPSSSRAVAGPRLHSSCLSPSSLTQHPRP